MHHQDVRRVAMISVHTSPLAQPGTGDAGGMNVYVLESARQLGRAGVGVEIFTRRTSAADPDVVQVDENVLVRHITAGPFEGLGKEDLPGQLCAFAAGMMQTAARLPEQWYDVVHSHYWLSGQVGWLAADRWQVPLVHTMHTMARVKNLQLAAGDRPEPSGREIGEAQVVTAAQRLVANTDDEACQLVSLYEADPGKVSVVTPGVDLDVFGPGDRSQARAHHDIPDDAVLLLFVGRIQPLKAPDVLVKAAARMVEEDPSLRDRLVVAVLGGPSGSGTERPRALQDLARELGIADLVRFLPPCSRADLAQWYRAADVLAVPSHNESFGLVAVEALACGTPVVAARVGGLPVAVGPGGVLVDGHDPQTWARTLADLVADPQRARDLGRRGVEHAQRFSWAATAEGLLRTYRMTCGDTATASIDRSERLQGIPSAVIP